MSQLVQSVVFVTVAHRTADPEAALAVVNGEVLLAHTVRGLLGTPEIDLVAVVVPERCAASFSGALGDLPARARIVPGPSLRSAFAAVEPSLSPDAVVLVHDALRAFTPQGTIRDVLGAVRAGRVVVPVLPMADTVKSTGEARLITGTVDRDGLRTAQTPVGFPLPEFRAALVTDEVLDAAVLAGAATVPGHPDAMRVASAFELTLAEALVALHGHEEPL
ncbi:IspD/TarI family cytidylyltransferase [Amycolatopsis saalfeldensis]|uniref:2-C-methyl-D-erythritol 4-phosphate cytidylyltransferase n=1 Tax=Amycolatopsis saalfeldensis TaxID=394193 RepID=A0A1H8WDH6_9PSEU|nr:2-C-methyl-D-erythritol 4-phosphate cytidylyltransferase [Amycolatopsis saalfeldensis]SEP25563.1 2-C-methyl-D-erythritol 4-phosphate cytidylyltransferase [Amycolatopsis saalfeldensis]